MVKELTVKEKFDRFMNPQTVSDYGLSISFDELISFDEGLQFAKEWLPWLFQTEEGKKLEEEMLSVLSKAGINFASTMDKIAMEVLNNGRK